MRQRLMVLVLSIFMAATPTFAASKKSSKATKPAKVVAVRTPEKRTGITPQERKKRQERFAKMHPRVARKPSQLDQRIAALRAKRSKVKK